MKPITHRWSAISVLLSCLSFSTSAYATPWEQVESPSYGAPQAIGSYANGCLAGGEALPLEGQGYQVLRSQRGRYYGHPNAIGFVERLSRSVQQSLNTQLLIADISLPQGGRFSSGHSSHQTGLDIDIWLKLSERDISDAELSEPIPHSLVNLKQYQLVKNNWEQRHFELVKLAASDDDVARIFVHPVIKDKLCKTEVSDERDWLRKVRPWWGHHYHMHVRLNCPPDSTSCKPQAAPPEGDGCGAELMSWKPQPKPAAPKVTSSKPKKKKPKVLPNQCQQMLDNS